VHNYSKTVSSQQDRDVNKAGKVVGYDLLYLVFNPKTERRSSTSPPSPAAGITVASLTGELGAEGEATVRSKY
jgi:hypothetical protein